MSECSFASGFRSRSFWGFGLWPSTNFFYALKRRDRCLSLTDNLSARHALAPIGIRGRPVIVPETAGRQIAQLTEFPYLNCPNPSTSHTLVAGEGCLSGGHSCLLKTEWYRLARAGEGSIPYLAAIF